MGAGPAPHEPARHRVGRPVLRGAALRGQAPRVCGPNGLVRQPFPTTNPETAGWNPQPGDGPLELTTPGLRADRNTHVILDNQERDSLSAV